MSGAKGTTADQSSAPTPPSISLPKGGGAIRGIGEKFGANPVTGTGSMSVPIATSPGRSGVGPQLSLSYDSGAGNGAFGFGWSLSLPSITRKTDKGLPRYFDSENFDSQDSDVFILSGAEDLVPVLVKQGDKWVPEKLPNRKVDGIDYRIRRFRPRIEGLFARIERWTKVTTGEIHWRSISRDNITTLYGQTNESRIFDPADPDPAHPTRIFSWLICQSYDDKGNAIKYEYKAEDSDGIDCGQIHERNRTELSRSANRYLKRIHYGNRSPNRDADWNPTDPALLTEWMFEVVFDYGEHDADAPGSNDSGVWPVRNDPFSSYRAGFEVRTYRLCQRILMFHHFPGEPGVGADCLVRSSDFDYSYEENPSDVRNPIYSFLLSVTQSGYKRNSAGAYLKKSLPPVELTYTEATIQEEIREVDPESVENLPIGLDGNAYQWVDLDGEGISGILTEQADAWFYKRNLSPLLEANGNGSPKVSARFAPIEAVASKPAVSLAGGHAQFMDLAGDGQLDVVTLEGPVPGLYERRTEDADWEPFQPFRSFPNLDTRDPNLRFIDLNGDGHNDILVSEDEVFRWYPSLAEDGFGPSEYVRQSHDEEKGPRLVLANPEQSIYLADVSGDGLTDLVRIRNGEVCYWPNLGYGRFGAKVTMDNSPWFDSPDQFDQKRIRLADIDGSATTDIIYLHSDGPRIYFNQSGNSWSKAQPLKGFPCIDNLASVQTLDLLGNGTACLVWSSPLLNDARRQMRYIDLMGQKPHLLMKTVNNLGAETRIEYTPSTEFYLADKAAGTPWVTKLPFPVHVVKRVETYDYVSRNRFVTRWTYHHGFYDGVEREFRGFGRVDQLDTEELAALTESGNFPVGDNIDPLSNVPPVLTKTWFHTGVYLQGERVSRRLAHEYYAEGTGERREVRLSPKHIQAMLLDDTILPEHLTPEEAREACRSLRGAMLRQEIYAMDGKEESRRPYTVTESNYTIRSLQRRWSNRHSVFFTHARESLSFNYERKLYEIGECRHADPRVSHGLTLEVDDYGNVLKSVAIGYGRRFPDLSLLLTDADQTKQAQILLTLTENTYTNAVNERDAYRTPLPSESRLYQLINIKPSADLRGVTNLIRFHELAEKVRRSGHDLAFEDWQATGAVENTVYRRLLKQSRSVYRSNRLDRFLPLGTLESLALPGESYKLAFTPSLLETIYTRNSADQPPENLLPNPIAVLGRGGSDGGGYADLDGDRRWLIPSGRVFFHPDPDGAPGTEYGEAVKHFFLPRRFEDPFRSNSRVDYDVHDLLAVRTVDAQDNTMSADNDYRVLEPKLIIDPNGNRSAAAFDTLGLVCGSAVMGKVIENVGDSLADFRADLTQAEIDQFFSCPKGSSEAMLLGPATTRIVYDPGRFYRTRKTNPDHPDKWQPSFAATLARETHGSDLVQGQQTKIQVGFSHSDGFGREIQRKIQAEPGPFDLAEHKALNPRWVGSGWVIFNNKGKPVREYEPFFSATHDFEFANNVGVSPTLFYDPLERLIATLHPNHTWEKVVFDPWQQKTWDVNDTVQLNPKSDRDVGDLFSLLPDADYLPTWFELRTNAANVAASWPDADQSKAEREAALKAAAHNNTPTTALFDVLGRQFLSIAHNRFENHGASVDEFYATRTELDIEGNQRAVTDALGRNVMTYDYDMFGNRIHQASMEAGERWMLNDVTGKPIRAWDSRGFTRRMTYDPLRRPMELFVTENGSERLAERTVYGERQPSPETKNLRSKIFQVFDGAGVLTSETYDFKGNLLSSKRALLLDYKKAVDWNSDPATNGGTFTSSTTYDALNRSVTVTSPDGSVYRAIFNEANLLDKVDVNLRGAAAATSFVTNIDYNAKGQRQLIVYGNGVRTAYEYDPFTFRLIRLRSTRPAGLNGLASQLFTDPGVVQDLLYTYDPAGNITRIADVALARLSNSGRADNDPCDYTYDAIYRLIEATGREHIGQTARVFDPPDGNRRDYPFAGLADFTAHPSDFQAMRRYRQRYEYDAVGNFASIRQIANGGNWRRSYEYAGASLIEPSKQSNRLTRTTIGNGNSFTETYTYTDSQGNDVHGCMTAINRMKMLWNFKDQLQEVDLGGGGRGYYMYDAAGQRTRKVIETRNGKRKQECVYLGGFEVYREYDTSTTAMKLERESLHVVDDRQRLALVEMRTQGNGPAPQQLIRYQFGNHLGSTALELDDRAQIISYEEYTPYGSTSYQAMSSHTETPKRYRYTGKERDDENGFYYHGARYYAPWLGRWIASDPAGIADGLDTYAYVSNRPTTRVDPTGLGFWGHVWGGLKTVGGALETAAGAALVGVGAATSEIGIGIPIAAAGVIVTAHGVDTVQAGARQTWTGEQTDTFTSEGLQAAGVSRRNANLVDAGIGVVGTLGAGAVTRAPGVGAAAVEGSEGLVHLTTAESKVAIETSQTLGTGGTIYAGPSSLANASGFGITARTGLLPSQATSVVTLPEAAASAFRVPAVVGPFTAWQRLSGTVYTAGAGTIDLTTGVFTRVGPATNQLFIYGLDATTTTALHVGPALAGLDDPNNPTSGVSTNVLPTSDSVVVVGPGLLDLSSAPNNPSSFALTLTGNTPGAASVNGIGLTQEEIAAQQCLVPQPPNLTQ